MLHTTPNLIVPNLPVIHTILIKFTIALLERNCDGILSITTGKREQVIMMKFMYL